MLNVDDNKVISLPSRHRNQTDDVNHHYSKYATPDSNFHEIQHFELMEIIRDRWPLLSEISAVRVICRKVPGDR